MIAKVITEMMKNNMSNKQDKSDYCNNYNYYNKYYKWVVLYVKIKIKRQFI
jgi:hypothetical protein